MNDNIINEITNDLNIEIYQTKNVLDLLQNGSTIPFIARYRKEATGGLDETQIKSIDDVYKYQINLLKRKEDVIRLIAEKELLTPELESKINSCNKLIDIEDIYRPFKEKKKTKATIAIANGLEPLAKIIMSFPDKDLNSIVDSYTNCKVNSFEDKINGVKYIIAEWISDNASYRKWIRNFTYNNGNLVSKLKKNSDDNNKVYEMYYDYYELLKYIKPHRILAINRGENESVLSVSIEINKEKIINYLEEKIIKNSKSSCCILILDSINDSYNRLIAPSIEREIRSELTDIGENAAINNFSKNLEALLLTPPIKEKVVLGFDPGYINGCKLAVIDKTGKYLDSIVIKPFIKNNNSKIFLNQSKEIIKSLINKYKIDIIAIGNGTASRESEELVSNLIKENHLTCKYVIVSEAGASIYSASKNAISEFPNLAVEKRSAVSIGRRLQDPLAELVKIPPEGIGVGLYQHDVSSKKLSENLDFIVSKVVNSIGVNINTASISLLNYVSGLTKKNIDKIIAYREKSGRINSREELKKGKILTDKAYEQSIGFLRISQGNNILDTTSIHPESYNIALNLLKSLDMDITSVGTDKLIEKLNKIDLNFYKDKLNTDIYTLEDVIKSLKKPNLDPRDSMPQPLLKSDILTIKDLTIGMKLQGTIRNVVDFGAFIDIGLHEDGLVHISEITDKYIKHPSDILSVGDIVDCYVKDIDLNKNRVSLTLKNKYE